MHSSALGMLAVQEESLRSKPKVLANIEELERLQPLLREARNEDKAQVEAACKAEAEAVAEEASASRIAELEAVHPAPPAHFILAPDAHMYGAHKAGI